MSARGPKVRKESPLAWCHGCHARVMVGEPNPSAYWTAALNLADWQVDLLLNAAAEYEELSEDSQHISNAIEFVDWLSPDVLPEKVHPIDQRIRREKERERRRESGRVA